MGISTSPDFLSVLDALIRADAGPPGAVGTLVFGVREPNGLRWWRCTLSGRAESDFPEDMPAEADVMVGLRPTEAGQRVTIDDVVRGEANWVVSGDTQLLDRFVKRYLRPASSLGVRFGGGV